MSSDMDASWFARQSGRSSRRRLTVLFASVALLASMAAPTAADQPVVVESVDFQGQLSGIDDDDSIGLRADWQYYGHSATAFGAGGARDAEVRIDFERDKDHLTRGFRCRGVDGTGTVRLFDDSWSVEREVTLHGATIEFGGWSFLNGSVGSFAFTGRWKDDTGSTGAFAGSGYYWGPTSPDLGASGCVVKSYFGWPMVRGEMSLLTDGGSGDLVDIVPGGSDESKQCEANGGSQSHRVIDSTNQGVRTFVYAYQPAVDEVWICARVEDTSTGEGYGGRLEATPGDAGPGGGPGTPTEDPASTACTTTTDPPNQVPGSHPISQGGVATVDYMVDAYANDDEAWLCLQVGALHYRVIVPLGGSGTSLGTVATWYPDEGTPTP